MYQSHSTDTGIITHTHAYKSQTSPPNTKQSQYTTHHSTPTLPKTYTVDADGNGQGRIVNENGDTYEGTTISYLITRYIHFL